MPMQMHKEPQCSDSRIKILHISADFPDSFIPQKTKAISRMLDLCSDVAEHHVYSLNRIHISVANYILRRITKKPVVTIMPDEGNFIVKYTAPRFGIFLKSISHILSKAIADHARKLGLKADLVHGHKLSVEGPIAEQLAKNMQLDYMLTLQGNSDKKILSIRRDLRYIYRRCYHNATAVIAFTPWISDYCDRYLGARTLPVHIIPCATNQDKPKAPTISSHKIISAFHLDHYRLKNTEGLIKGFKEARDEYDLTLEIAGGGPAEAEKSIDLLFGKYGVQKYAKRIGNIPHENIASWMNDAAVFAMISHHESFGMVFIEALFAGCPIIYPKGIAVSGYFDGCTFAVPVEQNSPSQFANAVHYLIDNQESVKADLLAWQQGEQAKRFQREHIASAYRDTLANALERIC